MGKEILTLSDVDINNILVPNNISIYIILFGYFYDDYKMKLSHLNLPKKGYMYKDIMVKPNG